MMARTYDELKANAEAALTKGFTSESARKDTLSYMVQSAYEIASRDDLSDKGYDAPYSIAQWGKKAIKRYGQTPARIQALLDLRVAILSAQLVAKPKSNAKLEEEARLTEAMTCQICGRPILAELGVIAHHGYERPGWGWQTASCPGARELPFENDAEALRARIEAIKGQLARTIVVQSQTKAEEIELYVDWQVSKGYDRIACKTIYDHFMVHFTRATFEFATKLTVQANAYFHEGYAHVGQRGEYDEWKRRRMAELAKEIKNLREYIKFQEGRMATFKKVATWRERGDGRAYWIRGMK